ncbi:hypothetical protein [Micromonospora echinospora]|uniref:hypothetical protein n=1 Tax=Micromonospora echinospora TaxID=1877 RepID=UPI00366C0007
MQRRISSVVAAVAMTVALTTTTTSSAAASAATGQQAVALPSTTAADVVSAGDRVFVSGGRLSSQIVVAAANGDVLTTVSGLPGPTDLLLSADRQTLYVALPTANAIAALNTGTLVEFARYDTGAGECPSSLALTGRHLWFGYGCDQWGGNIGRIDLGRQPAVVTTGMASHDYYGAPLLTAATQNRTVLLAGQPSLSPASAHVYAIGAGGALSLQHQNDWSVLGSNLRDIALNPPGATVYTAAGAPYAVQAFPVTAISTPSTTYATGAYPIAVELSRDGARVAAGASATYDPDVFVFAADGTEQVRYELGAELVAGALAWSPNGARLYAVTADWQGVAPATLHVLTPPSA